MPSARLTVDPHFSIGPIQRPLFGGFVEHLSDGDISYIDRCIAELAPAELGYRTPGVGPRPFMRQARA